MPIIDTMRCVSSLHCQKVYWVYISLPVWMHVYRYSINASAPMNYIFIEFYTISRFYVTLYLLSYCIFHFSWCRIYMYVYVHIYIYVYICLYLYAYVYVCICLRMHVTMYTWLYVCLLCVLILCMLILWSFFTYGCLVRDDLIKKFKQNKHYPSDANDSHNSISNTTCASTIGNH